MVMIYSLITTLISILLISDGIIYIKLPFPERICWYSYLPFSGFIILFKIILNLKNKGE